MTRCGARQSILQRNPYAENKTPMHRLVDPVLNNVQDTAIAYLLPSACEADPESLNCSSGPNNVLVTFTDVIYGGDITPIGLYKDFQIVSNVENIGGSFSSCELKQEWNAYQCGTDEFGLLMFENLDETATVTLDDSIEVTNQWTGFNNTVYPMRDQIGETEGQQNVLARYPVVLNTGEDYTMRSS